MSARRTPLPGSEVSPGEPILVPIGLGSGLPRVSASVAFNYMPAATPTGGGRRVTLTLNVPAGSMTAYFTLDTLDVLEDEIRAAREQLLASFEPEVGHG